MVGGTACHPALRKQEGDIVLKKAKNPFIFRAFYTSHKLTITAIYFLLPIPLRYKELSASSSPKHFCPTRILFVS
jgi:hypothetical protein